MKGSTDTSKRLANTVIVDGVVVQAPASSHSGSSAPVAIPGLVVMGTVVGASSAAAAPHQAAKSTTQPPSSAGSDEGIVFVQHAVEFDDNLTTLSIRYGSTVEGIMKANNLLTKDLDLLPKGAVLHIPRTHEKPIGDMQVPSSAALSRHALEERDRLRRRIVKDFAQTHACSAEEAAYYLEDHNFDVGNAAKARSDDVHWERSAGGQAARKQFKAMLRKE